MPSASAKLEKQASHEVLDPMKQVLNIIEKKVRNLEKRKGKLDTYKLEFSQGKELNEDQKGAIEKYNEVITTLEFSKDLQKTFCTIYQDSLKAVKKQQKREQAERLAQEQERIKELLTIQDVLNNLGLDHVRNSFLNGTHGAPLLTQDNLNQLDELYKLVSPSREVVDQPYDDQVVKSVEHIISLLDSKPKEIVSSTYKDLHEMIFKIHESGFLSSSFALQKGEVNGDEFSEEENAETSSKGEYPDETEEFTQVETAPEETTPSVHETENTTEQRVIQQQQQQQQQQQRPDTPPQIPQIDTYFATYQPTSARSTTEVISAAVQGHFNFLQESQLDLDSAHMDPAVVAAMPMAPGSYNSQQSDSLSGPNAASYQCQHQVRNTSPAPPTQYASSQTSSAQVGQQSQAQLMASQLPMGHGEYGQPIPTQTFTNQTYVTLPQLSSATNFPSPNLFHGQLEAEIVSMSQGSTVLQQQQQQLQQQQLQQHHQQQQSQQQSASSEASSKNLTTAESASVMAALQAGEPKKHYMNVNAVAFTYKQPDDVEPTNMSSHAHPSSASSVMINPTNSFSDIATRPSPPPEQTTAPGSYPHPNLNQQGHTFQNRVSNFGNNMNNRGGQRGGGGGGGKNYRGGSSNGYNARGGGGRGGNNYNAPRSGGIGTFNAYRDQPQQQQASNNVNTYFPNQFPRDNSGSGFGGNFSNGGGGGYKRLNNNNRGRSEGNLRGAPTGNRGGPGRGGGNMRGAAGAYRKNQQQS